MAIQIRTQRISIPERGKISSAKLNEWFANVVYDLAQMSTKINARESSEKILALSTRDELISIQGEVLALRSENDQLKVVIAEANGMQPFTIDMHEKEALSFLSGATAAVRASVSRLYGQATVPMNGIQQKFVSLDFRTNEIVAPTTLITEVVGTFDKLGGDGAVDYEYTGAITEGDITLAFNGVNADKWIRQVSFPLESDVDNVEMELTVQVPQQTNPQSNTLILHPYPWNEVDITEIAIASDLTSSFTGLPGFSEVRGAGRIRVFFPTQTVAQIRVRFRQRNGPALNGRKVFRYGLEELGLQLVDWDKTWDGAEAEANNHSMVHEVPAPTGHKFTSLEGFWSTPDFGLEDAGLRHMHFKIAADENGDVVLWDSDTDALPQDSQILITGERQTLYVITTLNWVATSGGTSSPFQVGTTPFVTKLGLRYKSASI